MRAAIPTLSLCAVMAWLPAQAMGADVWFVSKSASGGATGESWQDAFTDLQAALAVADSGDQIWLTAGTYRPDEVGVDQDKTFSIPAGVALYGGFIGSEVAPTQRDPAVNVSILDGDLLQNDQPNFVNYADNSRRVVVIEGFGASAVLDGLTIRGGRGPIDSSFDAAGVTVKHAAATLVACIIKENRNFGGFAGGMTVDAGEVMLVRSLFFQNRSPSNGGAFRAFAGSEVRAFDCGFIANRAPFGGGAGEYSPGSSGSLVNCVVAGNNTNLSGGGLQLWGAAVDVVGCTITMNLGGVGGGGAGITTVDPGPVRILNSIIWGNDLVGTETPTEQVSADSQTTLESCCLQPPNLHFGGTNLIFSDPLFVDPMGPDLLPGTLDDDYRLSAASSCIDAGTNQHFPADELDVDCDSNLTEPMPLDGRHTPRYVDQPAVLDTGVGPPPIVDIGAYEHSGWTSQGHFLEGASGVVPCATPGGDWIPGREVSLELRRGPRHGLAAVVLSSSTAKLPFKGGVLVPAPDEAFVAILDSEGHALLADTVPVDQPFGSLLVLQPWFLDPGAPFGASAGPAFSGLVHP